jgi:hypothetical protein
MYDIVKKIEVIVDIHFSYGIVSVIKLSIHYELEIEILFRERNVMCSNMHN